MSPPYHGWALELIWTQWQRGKIFAPARNQTPVSTIHSSFWNKTHTHTHIYECRHKHLFNILILQMANYNNFYTVFFFLGFNKVVVVIMMMMMMMIIIIIIIIIIICGSQYLNRCKVFQRCSMGFDNKTVEDQ
jgi:predicted membrane protein